MISNFRSLFSSKNDNTSDSSTFPTLDSKEKRKEGKSASGHGMEHRDYASGHDPQMHHHSGTDLKLIRSRLVEELHSSLSTAVTDNIRKACGHWDNELHRFEDNYQSVLEERNALKSENKKLEKRVKALEARINDTVTQLRELQSDHFKTAGSRKLAPPTSAISNEFEDLERNIKDVVFARLARLNIEDSYIQTLLHHQPFLEAIKGITAENTDLSHFKVVEETEKKGLLLWIVQGVIHNILHMKIMKIHMPGLNINELQVIEKILHIIELSEEDQGIKSAQQWRADTYRRLAYWAENVKELDKYTKDSPAIGEINQIFSSLIDDTRNNITGVLEPLCDASPEGRNFSHIITDIVDRAFKFSILIGSQTARYELQRDVNSKDDFKTVPDHLNGRAGASNHFNVPLLHVVPALIKTSSEDGEVYDVPELLVHGKIYVLFRLGDPIEEEQVPPDVPENIPIQLASSVNGGNLENQEIEVITDFETCQGAAETTPDLNNLPTDLSTKPSGADTLPNESNPSMTEISEIILEQGSIVISECKNRREPSDQISKNKPNSTTTTTATTPNSSKNNTPIETLNTANQLDPAVEGAVEGALHQEISTKTYQVITRPKDLDPQQSYPEDTKRTLRGIARRGAPAIVRKEDSESRKSPDGNSSLPKPPQAPFDPRASRASSTGGPGNNSRTSMSRSSPSRNRSRLSPNTSPAFNSGIVYNAGSKRSGGDPPFPSTSGISAGGDPYSNLQRR